jgi:hypothetical protein
VDDVKMGLGTTQLGAQQAANKTSSCDVAALEQRHTCSAVVVQVVQVVLGYNGGMLREAHGEDCAAEERAVHGGLEMLAATLTVATVVSRQQLILQIV